MVRYAGNFESYRRLKPSGKSATRAAAAPAKASEPARPRSRPVKLGYQEQRELDAMEAAIGLAEGRVRQTEAALADPATYSGTPARIAPLKAELVEAGKELERLYARWQQLLDKAKG